VGITVAGGGNLYVADSNNQTIRKMTPAGAVSTFVGSVALAGSLNGSGTAARFNAPLGVAADSAKNVYVADTDNHTIRKITADGVVSTFAGLAGTSGSSDGIGTIARFSRPYGVATDRAGNVYVADRGNNMIRKITSSGNVSTLAGSTGTYGSVDGTGAAAQFDIPYSVATDSAGNVYVAERGDSIIRKITPGGVVTTLAGFSGPGGSVDGTGTAALFSSPNGVATDSAGNVYVADTNNHIIRKITSAGVVTTFAGLAGAMGSANGTGTAARFNYPTGVATDSAGNVYVADKNNHTIRKITPARVVSTIVGVAGKADFAAGSLPGTLVFPSSVAVIGNTLYITSNNGVAVVNNLP
jgi:sugar lactone lactonase YvrE